MQRSLKKWGESPEIDFYINTGVGTQQVVFKRQWSDISPHAPLIRPIPLWNNQAAAEHEQILRQWDEEAKHDNELNKIALEKLQKDEAERAAIELEKKKALKLAQKKKEKENKQLTLAPVAPEFIP